MNNQLYKQSTIMLTKWARGRLAEKGIKSKDLASLVGISPSGLSTQFNRNRLSTEVLMAVIYLTNADPREVLK